MPILKTAFFWVLKMVRLFYRYYSALIRRWSNKGRTRSV